MNQYFLEITAYVAKNSAHKEMQEFAKQYDHCLIDEKKLERMKIGIKTKLDRVNAKHTRCQDIQLSGWKNSVKSERIAVDGNFYLDIKKVERFELTPTRDLGCDLIGDMKANAD